MGRSVRIFRAHASYTRVPTIGYRRIKYYKNINKYDAFCMRSLFGNNKNIFYSVNIVFNAITLIHKNNTVLTIYRNETRKT